MSGSETYNEIGQLTQTINPAGLITAYQYDADRKLIGKTDPKGQTTAYLYDPAGQLIQKNLLDDQVQYFYDTMGNVSTVMDSTSRVMMGYDGQNRLIQSEIGFDTSLPITIHQNTTVEAGNKLYDFRDVTVDGAVLTLSGSHTFTNLNVINGATVTHKGATTTTTSSLTLEVAHTLTIDATSRIDVSDKGYLGGYRGDNSSDYGRTVGNTTTGGSFAYSAGSYGGLGGQIYNYAVNGVYGSLYAPDELGSGGGGDPAYGGGNGGGLVRITAGEIVLDGRIQADGGDGALYFNGAGSGGGINIQTGVLRGTGSITANGGKSSSGHSSTTGGGGGRIAVHYSNITGFDPAHISAYGGVGPAANGGAGTVYLKSSAQQYGNLIIGNNNIETSGFSTPLLSLGTGISTRLTADTLTDEAQTWRPDDLVGLYLNPNVDQSNLFRIIANGGTALTTDPNDGDMTAVSAPGSTYAGGHILDRLDIKDQARLTILGGFIEVGDLSIQNNGVVTHPAATTTDTYSLDIKVRGTLTIDATSRIDVSEKGYLGGWRGDNSSFYGRTVGNTTTGGSYASSGGSYGGLGGQYSDYAVNGVYGSLYHPDELGSGGGGSASGSWGGNGGGLVRITAGEIVLNGRIQADGGDGANFYYNAGYNGGGSGGGIKIQSGVLRGTGSITANGGKNFSGYSNTTGGGGGRIAVYYNDITGFNTANITAYGGGGSVANGGAGTIYLKNSAQPYGDLIVDNDGVATSGFSTPLPSVGSGLSTDLTGETLSDNTRNWGIGDLVGIYLNPNKNQTNYPQIVFPILANDTDRIMVDPTNYNVTDIAQIGDPYIGEHHFDHLTIVYGGAVETQDDVYFNAVDSTGGSIQANNFYQIGKNSAKPRLLGLTRFNQYLITTAAKEDKARMDREKANLAFLQCAKVVAEADPVNPQVLQMALFDPVQELSTLHDRRSAVRHPSLAVAGQPLETVSLGRSEQSLMSLRETRNHEKVFPLAHKLQPGSRDPETRNQKPGTRNFSQQEDLDDPEPRNESPTNDQRPDRGSSPVGDADPKAESPKPESIGIDPEYTYDLNGNRTSMITPAGTFTYSYDSLDRLTGITNPDGETTTFTYDALGRRTSMTYANGVTTTYSYDAASRLVSMTTDKDATNLSRFSYSYDKAGNRIAMTDQDGVHRYTYDDQYRLTGATHPQPFNPAESYTYDPVGNRLSSHLSAAYSYDNLNRLLEDDQYRYSYDANGNLIRKVEKTSGKTTTYQYDSENQLIQVVTPNNTVTYQYDRLGRRIAKVVNGAVTRFVYDNEDILFEMDQNGNIQARYTHGPGIDEPISVDRDTDGDGTFDATYYYHYDGLGSVTKLTDSTGIAVQSYAYDSFGQVVQQVGAVLNPYTYTGREFDQESGLNYYRARYYDSRIGRFLQEDPIGFLGEIHFYAYVSNNPVNWVDPKGAQLIDRRGIIPIKNLIFKKPLIFVIHGNWGGPGRVNGQTGRWIEDMRFPRQGEPRFVEPEDARDWAYYYHDVDISNAARIADPQMRKQARRLADRRLADRKCGLPWLERLFFWGFWSPNNNPGEYYPHDNYPYWLRNEVQIDNDI